jgi:hypothetical protein
MAPGIGNRYARALVYTGQQCVFNDDDYRATNQGQAIKVKSFGDGQGYSPSHHDGVCGQYRDGDVGERNNVVEEVDGYKVGVGGCLKGLLAFNLLSCRGIGVFARQRTQEGTEAKTPVGPIYAGDMFVTWPGGGSSTPYRRPDGSTTVMDAFVAGHFRVLRAFKTRNQQKLTEM